MQSYISPPSQFSNFQLMQNKIFEEFFAHRIGIINNYNSSKNTATISLVDVETIVSDINTVSNQEFPPLSDIPIFRDSTENAGITKPINVGDTVLLLFNDTNIDNFLKNPSVQTTFVNFRHDYNNAIALPYDFKAWIHNNNATEIFYNKTTKISLDAKVGIANDAGSLKTYIDSLIDIIIELTNTLASLQTIPAVVGSPLTLDPGVISSLNNIASDLNSNKTNFDSLLKV